MELQISRRDTQQFAAACKHSCLLRQGCRLPQNSKRPKEDAVGTQEVGKWRTQTEENSSAKIKQQNLTTWPESEL